MAEPFPSLLPPLDWFFWILILSLSLCLFLSLVILYGRLGMVSARTWPGKKSSLANCAPRERAEGDFWSQKHASYAKSLCNTSPANGDIFYGPWGKVVPRHRDIVRREESYSWLGEVLATVLKIREGKCLEMEWNLVESSFYILWFNGLN